MDKDKKLKIKKERFQEICISPVRPEARDSYVNKYSKMMEKKRKEDRIEGEPKLHWTHEDWLVEEKKRLYKFKSKTDTLDESVYRDYLHGIVVKERCMLS